MMKSKFTEQQIAFALQQAENGTTVAEVCRKMGIAEATFYRWKQLYGGLMPSEVKQLRPLEEENTRLRKVVADLLLAVEQSSDELGNVHWAPTAHADDRFSPRVASGSEARSKSFNGWLGFDIVPDGDVEAVVPQRR